MAQYILVVDDDEGILEVVQMLLEGEGYRVKTCMNASFMQKIHEQLPSLILLDILLSSGDGREICQCLKNDERTKHIPVIMLSAHSDASKVADAGGADDFLEKPFDVDALIRAVEKYLAPA